MLDEYMIIPRSIMFNQELNKTDKVLLAAVYDSHQQNLLVERFYLSEATGISIPSLHRSVIRLKKLKYIYEIKSDYREINWRIDMEAIEKSFNEQMKEQT